jgi:hypothetical protein
MTPLIFPGPNVNGLSRIFALEIPELSKKVLNIIILKILKY